MALLLGLVRFQVLSRLVPEFLQALAQFLPQLRFLEQLAQL